MIKLNGMICGKKFEMKCEDNTVCMVFQTRLRDLMDIQLKEGCPEDCIYVVRKQEDNPYFICNVLIKKEN